MVLIALGMAGAVAPLTTAALSLIDARHTGSASGFNSAVPRTGGLVATALPGPGHSGIVAIRGVRNRHNDLCRGPSRGLGKRPSSRTHIAGV
jgi:hypothetical protein